MSNRRLLVWRLGGIALLFFVAAEYGWGELLALPLGPGLAWVLISAGMRDV